MSEMYGQLNKLREEIMNKAMTNMDFLKFIYYYDKLDILTQPDLTATQRKSLLDTQIFKYKRMPIVNQSEAKCFISMSFGRVMRDRGNNHWSIPLFTFTIVCADNIVETTEGNRILAIEQCLEDVFSYKNIGNGIVYAYGSEPETVDSGFQARTIVFKFMDYIE